MPRPQAEFSPLIDLLYLADQVEQEQFRGFRDLLAPDLTPAVETLLITRSLGLGGNRLDALLNDIAAAAARLKVEKNLTDWPFQHFWGNPYEPRHSKLLRYFLDPAEEHGSGSFLLQRFFEVLAGSDGGLTGHNFPADRCSVTDGIDYIDLLIKREHPDRRFAIIIENKINDAVHQDKQLTRYVTKLQGEFAASEIYVLYLPLHTHKDPDADDLNTLPPQVHYRKITFETHVLKWLNAVLLNSPTEELPLQMRENLSHYRNLLMYLVNQRKTQRMNEHILKKLAAAETLPTLSEVEKL